MIRLLAIFLTGAWFAGFASAQEAKLSASFKILDGKPTRIFFTGNPHHPTFGHEKLASLLNRYFDNKNPIRVDGLSDGRKDPITKKPIPTAKIPELIRFLQPEFDAVRPKGERWVVLTYVIVEEPRVKTKADWVKERADEMEAYAKEALAKGVDRVFFSEMVQPDHIMAGNAGNRFRRAGLPVFDVLQSRKLPGVERGPDFQIKMEKHKHFFRDDRHYSVAGKDYMGCLWFEALLRHDGLSVPTWCQDEITALLKAAN